MSRHSFDPEVATQVGVNAAVIYQNIAFWCEKNEANEKHIHDGMAWSYNSITAFEKLFPYLTKSQIRTAIEKTVEAGLLLVGNYNKDPRDKTKWYAINRTCICEKSQMELSEIADPFAKNRKPLPDIKPDSKQTPIPPEGAGDLFSDSKPESRKDELADQIEAGFEDFKSIWPKGHPRRQMGPKVRKKYEAAVRGKLANASASITPSVLNAAARKYIASVKDPQFIKGTEAWLNGALFESYLPSEGGEHSWDSLSISQQTALSEGRVPGSMQDENGQANAVARYWLEKLRRVKR